MGERRFRGHLMSDPPLYTLRDIAQELHLPESTVRYYRDAFAQYLPTVGAGRRRRYPPEAVATLRLIALWYHEGKLREHIEHELAGLHPPEIHERPSRSDVHSAALAGIRPADSRPLEAEGALAALMEGERERRQAMWQMAREIVRLGETVERQETLLNGIHDRLAQLTDRALPAAQQPEVAALPPDQHGPVRVDWAAPGPAPPAPATRNETGSTADMTQELEALRQELATERDLVERLRKSKLELERRAAEAEARAGTTPGRGEGGPKRSMFGALRSRKD